MCELQGHWHERHRLSIFTEVVELVIVLGLIALCANIVIAFTTVEVALFRLKNT